MNMALCLRTACVTYTNPATQWRSRRLRAVPSTSNRSGQVSARLVMTQLRMTKKKKQSTVFYVWLKFKWSAFYLNLICLRQCNGDYSRHEHVSLSSVIRVLHYTNRRHIDRDIFVLGCLRECSVAIPCTKTLIH
jgi:hypothetical protein